jgi:L-alanine-DL-glutamate epimerase-like enolase superfamily enzyme
MTAVVAIEAWKIAGDGFTTARETKRDAFVVHVILERDGKRGEGECFPLKRFGYTPEQIKTEVEDWLAQNYPWETDVLQKTLKPGPARFALDTAILQLHGLKSDPFTLNTAFTLSGAAPDVMAALAKTKREFRWLKTKLLGDGLDRERLEKIHEAAPDNELIIDANESLTIDTLSDLLPVFKEKNVILIEQPLPEGKDDMLKDFKSPIPLAADESCHTIDDLEKLHSRYQVINIKLDKTGGLTHAMAMKKRAQEMGFKVMVGCMASTSLSIYPAALVARDADYVDLDGALLLEKDREGIKIAYRDGRVYLLG